MMDASFAELYHSSYQRLAAQLTFYLGDPAEAEDVLQEAYLRTWQRWDRIGSYDDPPAYLRRVAWNLATSRWRRLTVAARHLRRLAPAEHVDEVTPDHVAVVTALKQLPEPQRRAIVLHHLADLPVDEVAAELGAARGTVLSWLHRGRGKLGTLLDDSPASEGGRPAPPVGEVGVRARRRRRTQIVAVVAGLVASAAALLAVLPSARLVDPPVVDSILDVDWTDTALDLPAGAGGCPSGHKRIRPERDGLGLIAGPRNGITDPLYLHRSKTVYGDVTGDGQPEAIMPVWCSLAGADLSNSEVGRGARLLVVTMRSDRTLLALAYVGPPGAAFRGYAAVNGELVTQVQYETETAWSSDAPAHRRVYRWDGSVFVQTAGRTEPLVLLPAKLGAGSPVRLAGTAVCPSRTVIFSGGEPVSDLVDTRWVDLNGDGDQEGLAQIRCGGTESLYLLGQGAHAFETLDVPFAGDGSRELVPDGWRIDGHHLTVKVSDRGEVVTLKLFWNGQRFLPY